jgi:phosphoenolpyruvate synthase/pyruvate phosphate dikinase
VKDELITIFSQWETNSFAHSHQTVKMERKIGMNACVLGFQEIDKTKLAMVGGKGANLGELSKIDGIRVPEGFCVTTEAYQSIIGQTPAFHALLEQLSLLKVQDRERIREISAKIRSAIEGTAIAKDIDEAVTSHLTKLGENNAYAVRSSATAEDLPTASFAGQQDTYLNIVGKQAILKHISKCWASLFTERAVIYRMQNGFDHNKVHLSVVIQRMVFPEAAGILFTADPITSNRKVVSIDASFGLGEALVSGLVDADIYKVQEGKIVSKKISTKKLAIYALKEGGTKEQRIGPDQQNMQTLADEQIVQLEKMGLELLDVADVVRQYPAVLDYFHYADDETFFEELEKVEGGKAVGDSIRNYLRKYGMRCPGEIDITRTRWAEKPTWLIPMIINTIKNFEPDSHKMIVEQKRLEAEQKGQELISRIERLPGGKRKAKKTRKMISVFRNFVGFREYPKYAMMQRFYVYKQALKKEAALLVQKRVIQEPEDISYLTFEELRKVASTSQLDYSIITKRKGDYEVFEKLTPPRVMTSDGEIIIGEYDTDEIPKGALIGVPVSSGTIEGRARIVFKLEEGDILVTVFTDPSWTALFVSMKGLVTEVGGMMTHGAVVAREYGLPAVVSVENATKLIKDGQRIRVNGTKGYVEILEE